MLFAVTGILLMGVDLLMTQNFFRHIGELMLASILCFILALVLDHHAGKTIDRATENRQIPPH